jgi:hypothetical protein
MSFKEGYKRGRQNVLLAMEQKALKKAPLSAEWLVIKVTGTNQLTDFSNRGWEVVSSVPLGRGAGFTQYLMRKKRSQVILDNAAAGVVV